MKKITKQRQFSRCFFEQSFLKDSKLLQCFIHCCLFILNTKNEFSTRRFSKRRLLRNWNIAFIGWYLHVYAWTCEYYAYICIKKWLFKIGEKRRGRSSVFCVDRKNGVPKEDNIQVVVMKNEFAIAFYLKKWINFRKKVVISRKNC